MNTDKIIDHIVEYEGFSEIVYVCPAGYYTIGHGLAIRYLRKEDMQYLWDTKVRVTVLCDTYNEELLRKAMHHIVITEEASLEIVRRQVMDIIGRLQSLSVPFVEVICDEAKEVIVDMAYNIGIKGVAGFKRMWGYLRQEEYDLAGLELLNSNYAKQTKSRAAKNAITLIRLKPLPRDIGEIKELWTKVQLDERYKQMVMEQTHLKVIF